MKIKEITESAQLDELIPLPKSRPKPDWVIAKIQRAKEREARRNEKPGQLKRKETPSQVKANVKQNMDFVDKLEKDGVSEAKKTEPSKPRNFVAKNAVQSGAGAHKDKKKAEKQGDVKHKGKQFDISEDGEPMKIAAVSGNDVTIDQGGQQIKTTADALAPGQQPGSFTMKPADPNSIKPGATVTSEPTAEDGDDGIHAEQDPDLMGSGENGDVSGDGTDAFIQDVLDTDFEQANRPSELNRIKQLSGLR